MGLIRDGIVKTKKLHVCHGCCEEIAIGTKVYSQTCVYDVHIYTIYMCDMCSDWCDNLKCNDCITSEDAHEGYIRECMKDKGVMQDEKFII